MNSLLVADFEKRFAGGPAIHGQLAIAGRGRRGHSPLWPVGLRQDDILSSLAGLERPERGRIEFAGQTWFDAATAYYRCHRSGVASGFLFQQIRALSASDRGRQCGLWLGNAISGSHAGTSGRDSRSPANPRTSGSLSGSNFGRAAAARSHWPGRCCRPRLLCLTNRLSALDAPVRERLRGQLRRILIELSAARDRGHTRSDRDVGSGRRSGRDDRRSKFARPDRYTKSSAGRAIWPWLRSWESKPSSRVRDQRRPKGWPRSQSAACGLRNRAPRERFVKSLSVLRGEDVLLQREVAATATSARNQLPARVTSRVAEGPMVRIGLGLRIRAHGPRHPSRVRRTSAASRRPLDSLVKAPAIHLVGTASGID